MDLFEVLIWAAAIAAGAADIALPVLFIVMLAGAGSFFAKSQKEKYENLRDFSKKVKVIFTIGIIAALIFIILLFANGYKNYGIIQSGILLFLIILGAAAFGKEKKADMLYRNLYPPIPTANAYKGGGSKFAAEKPKTDLPATAVTSDEDWDKLFGGNGLDSEKGGAVNENLDIAKSADKELMEYVGEEGKAPAETENSLNENLDLRKAPDRELMQYLVGKDTGTESVAPSEHKQAGKGDGLNVCPECGYLNFEGNTECDFCGAKLKGA